MRLTSLLSVVAAAALLLSACAEAPDAGAAPGNGPAGGMQLPVEAVTIAPEPLDTGLGTVGSLRADESVVVRPEVAGRITRIHFTEGGRVQAGQPLVSLDTAIAGAALREAEANLANSRSAATRASELVGEQLIARSDYDNVRAQRAVDEARVASARAALSKMTLRAPFSGQIGLRSVSVGEYVNAGQDLATLVRLDPIEVDFSVPETRLAALRVGQPVQVEVDAFPDQRFGGQVVAIDPVVDPNSRSVKLRAQVANPDHRLRPGQFARVRLQSGEGRQALLVPEQALMQSGEERFVYTVVDGKAKRTVVQTGTRVPGKVEVTAGLSPGDVVITAGQAKPMMADGMPVMVLPGAGAAGQASEAGTEAGADAGATEPAGADTR
jgi:membrane fusion protein, multidrug efflux system